MKKMLNQFKKQLAQLGRSMLIPVTAMPVAGLLSRIASDDMLNLPLLKAADSAYRIREYGHPVCPRSSRGVRESEG